MMVFGNPEQISVLLSLEELEAVKELVEEGLSERGAVQIVGEFSTAAASGALRALNAREIGATICQAIISGGIINVIIPRSAPRVYELAVRVRAYSALQFFFSRVNKPFNKEQIKFCY